MIMIVIMIVIVIVIVILIMIMIVIVIIIIIMIMVVDVYDYYYGYDWIMNYVILPFYCLILFFYLLFWVNLLSLQSDALLRLRIWHFKTKGILEVIPGRVLDDMTFDT